MALFVVLDVICELIVIIELVVLLFTVYERRLRAWIFVGRPDLRVPMDINDHLTVNRRDLNVRDLSIADNGNNLMFSITAKIYSLRCSLVYELQKEIRQQIRTRAVAAWVRPVWYLKNADNYTK